MKNMMLKLLASAALKRGIGYAFRVCLLTIDALDGVVRGSNIPDSQRAKLLSVIKALNSVSEFLERLVSMFGVRTAELGGVDALDDAVRNLNYTNDQL